MEHVFTAAQVPLAVSTDMVARLHTCVHSVRFIAVGLNLVFGVEKGQRKVNLC